MGGCNLNPSDLLAGWSKVRHLEVVPLDEARDRLARAEARLVQLREPQRGRAILRGAYPLDPHQEIPAELLESDETLLVVAVDRNAALRLSARLARAGARAGLVAADPQQLAEDRTASGPQPARHPSVTTGIERFAPGSSTPAGPRAPRP